MEPADNSINFESFVKEYSSQIYLYLARLTGKGEDAEDILQETLIRIAESLHSLKDPSSLKTWAFRIATNTAMDQFRKNGRYSIVEFDENIHEPDEQESGVEDKVIVDEMNECIRNEMSRLAPHYHTVLILYFFEHMSINEIADICGITVSAVKVRLHRGKNLLKKILSEGCSFYYDKNSNIRCVSKAPE
jgi:RNA polymerase sigma-70 factor (ECF subfamily)